MNNPVAGLYITGNSTIQSALAAGSKVTGWTASEALRHGDLSQDSDADNSRITLKPGIYWVSFEATVEAPETSGALTSGDAFGEITFQLYRAGSGVTGTKSTINDGTAGEPIQVCINAPIEITEAQLAAATNYVEVYAIAADASGNDILVKEARLHAIRLS